MIFLKIDFDLGGQSIHVLGSLGIFSLFVDDRKLVISVAVIAGLEKGDINVFFSGVSVIVSVDSAVVSYKRMLRNDG